MVQVTGTCGCLFEITRNFYQNSRDGGVNHTDSATILNICKEHDAALDTEGLNEKVAERTQFEQKVTDAINAKTVDIDIEPKPVDG